MRLCLRQSSALQIQKSIWGLWPLLERTFGNGKKDFGKKMMIQWPDGGFFIWLAPASMVINNHFHYCRLSLLHFPWFLRFPFFSRHWLLISCHSYHRSVNWIFILPKLKNLAATLRLKWSYDKAQFSVTPNIMFFHCPLEILSVEHFDTRFPSRLNGSTFSGFIQQNICAFRF